MRHKGDGCWSINRAELIAVLRARVALRYGKFGPLVYDPSVYGRELHPRRDTVRRMITAGELVESDDANEVQRSCGMTTYRLSAEMLEAK